MSERTAIQNPMLRYADEIGWGWPPATPKSPALERESALLDELFRALLEELMTGRVSVARIGVGDG